MYSRVQRAPLDIPPQQAARSVGLRYVSDAAPGITREKRGAGFVFKTPSGALVKDQNTLGRIRSLAIPPAWTDVWICEHLNGHLQATGRDVKGRKQHRYHPRWREVRDETKYIRMIEFGKALPRIRKAVLRDLARDSLPKQKVLATVIKLLEISLIRVGNEEYVKQNHSFGLTTMRDRHVEIRGSCIRFHFKGKSGKMHDVDVQDPKLARIVKKCQDIPGQELFQYIDIDGNHQSITSNDVNEYLREIAGEEFSAKDFRTWAGTVLAAIALQQFEKFDSKAQGKKNLVAAIETVAQRLGNTPAICKKCYIHPIVFESYLDGSLVETLQKSASRALTQDLARLRPEEAAVLAFIEARLAQPKPSLNHLLKKSVAQSRKK